MPGLTGADTIRILVATDSHVGYNERDPVRGDDSWKSFHEVMCLAKEQDVDMVLLAGDLFHENKPSRKSMYQVMRSLRMNCYGNKPCELEILSDASENFQGTFNHVNYEDMDINVAIPVFSIHGNHDDPSGEGHLAALDLLQVSGLLNYYGRTPESDNIQIKPVLLQKGGTKLALYGMSNVRDERLFRTFRDGKVKFFKPSMQQEDWFNLMSVHQNHHAHTETGYLPETFLPDFLDLVVWGHEHECLINPRLNSETDFHVMQPGSSVATSLVPGEAVAKHVALLSITGREFKSEPIRLKTVRPFVMKEIILSEEKEIQRIARKENNRTELTRFLMDVVEDLIEEARTDWLENNKNNQSDDDEEQEFPLPLIRLRVETSRPDGGTFDCENPQRFSNRFVGKVANVNDVVQFHRKKRGATAASRGGQAEVPDDTTLLASLDTVKVEKLVKEFLAAQSLTILPQNSFGDAVSQFVDKDDKHAMEMFVNESLEGQIKHLMDLDRDRGEAGDEHYDEDDEQQDAIQTAMDKYRKQLEETFSMGRGRRSRGKRRFKPKPDGWDSEFDGIWEDQPGALIHSDHGGDGEEEEEDNITTGGGGRGRGRGRGRGGSTRAGSATAAAATAGTTRGRARATARNPRRPPPVIEDDDDDDDVAMADDRNEDEEEEDSLFVHQTARKPPPLPPATTSRSSRAKQPARTTAPTRTRAAPKRGATPVQSTLTFGSSSRSQTSQSQTMGRTAQSTRSVQSTGTRARSTRATKPIEISDDDIEDDEDAFEPAPRRR